MPGWAGSSWYWFRYMDPKNDQEFAGKDAIKYWKDVDLYMGGSEHATGHLLYSRFWCKALKDLGYVDSEEPFKKLINQGHIQGVSQMIYKFGNLGESSSSIMLHDSSGNKRTLAFSSPKRFFISVDSANKWIHPNFIKLTSTNVPIVYVNSNNELNIDQYLTEWLKFDNAVFIVDNGYLHNGVHYDDNNEILDSNITFYTRPEVEKMSKSKHNVVNPDNIVNEYGADTLRMYEMFLGPLEQSKPWNTQGIDGVFKFLRRFWNLFHDATSNFNVSDAEPTKDELKVLHKTLKKIQQDIENFSFNTSVSEFMICSNELSSMKSNKRALLEPLVIALAPFAPHIAEELWEKLGHKDTVFNAQFPKYNEQYLIETSFSYPISINGKVRAQMNFALDMPKEDIEKIVMASEIVQKWSEGKPPKKVIIVPGKIVNVVL
jgi:leucyl-tRNA synthetase